MTPLERVLCTLGHAEPDRVPVFLLLTTHGAKELGLSIRRYFERPESVVRGQLRMLERYGADCVYPFHYAPLEVAAWGGEVVFHDDGPPTSGEPCLRDLDALARLEPPRVADSPGLCSVLEVTRGLAAEVGGRVPIIGVVMSPFSLPVMQLGFERYLEVLLERPEAFAGLMRANEAFAVEWANAQLEAGATAICYFDPVSSPTCVPPALYRETGFAVARRTLAGIRGPTATHLASAKVLGIVDELAQTGTAVVGFGAEDDVAALRRATAGRLTMLGNLNGLAMVRWSQAEAERAVRDVLEAAAPGGGFILSDAHGEIPFHVPSDTLHAIIEAARRFGTYPLGGR